MKTVIWVSEQEAIRQGKNEHGNIIVDYDPAKLTQKERDEMARSEMYKAQSEFDNDALWLNKRVYDESGENMADKLPCIGNAYAPEAIIMILQERIALRIQAAQQKTKRTEAVKKEQWAKLEDKVSRLERVNRRLADENEKLKIQTKREQAEESKRVNRERDERAAVQVAKWVGEYGTTSQRERLAENMLPEDEIGLAMQAQVFTPMADWPVYQTIPEGEACVCQYPEDRNVVYDDYKVATKVTAEMYEQLKDIRQRIPNAVITATSHNASCTTCEAGVTRTGFEISVTVGEFTFVREFAEKKSD